MLPCAGVDPDNYESFQVLRYEKGQFYNVHHDTGVHALPSCVILCHNVHHDTGMHALSSCVHDAQTVPPHHDCIAAATRQRREARDERWGGAYS